MRVLSGGERTRLAVARMLLRPSNTLLLDEPTNHLDLDSKEVLLDALVDYGGTLIFVSHDRYFVERLATKIIEVGNGTAIAYPGTYSEFLWHKEHPQEPRAPGPDALAPTTAAEGRCPGSAGGAEGGRHGRCSRRAEPARVQPANAGPATATTRKRADAEARRRSRAEQARRASRSTSSRRRSPKPKRAIRELEADDGRRRVSTTTGRPPSR